MKLISALFLLISCLLGYTAASYDVDDWFTVSLYHAIDAAQPHQFSIRGNISVNDKDSLSINQEPLPASDREKLRILAEKDKFYRLKAVVTAADGQKTSFLTFSSACGLVSSQLSDVIWLTLDHDSSVIGVSLSVPAAVDSCSAGLPAIVDDEFNTEIFIKVTQPAPTIDTNSFIQKMEREREARERGEVKDNRGFFAKYWMYLVPVVILLLISGSANPDAGGGGR